MMCKVRETNLGKTYSPQGARTGKPKGGTIRRRMWKFHVRSKMSQSLDLTDMQIFSLFL